MSLPVSPYLKEDFGVSISLTKVFRCSVLKRSGTVRLVTGKWVTGSSVTISQGLVS